MVAFSLLVTMCLCYCAWTCYFLLTVAIGLIDPLWGQFLACLVASVCWVGIGKQWWDLVVFVRESGFWFNRDQQQEGRDDLV